MDENPENGVKINLISRRKLDTMSSQEKLRFILDEIKKGTVLVLERGLTAVEEIDLIKATMNEIDHQTFIGIEMQSYSSDDLETESWFSKLIGRAKVPRMSVIGPANLLKTIHKNGTMVQAMILTGKSIVDNIPEEEGSEDEPDSESSEDLETGSDVDKTESDEAIESGTPEYGDSETTYYEPTEEDISEQDSTFSDEDSAEEPPVHQDDSMGFSFPVPEESSNYPDDEKNDSEQYQESYTSEPEPIPTPDYSAEESGTSSPPMEQESEIESEPYVPTERNENSDTIPFAKPVDEDSTEESQTYESQTPVSENQETSEPPESEDEAGTSFLYKRLKQEEE